MYEARIYCIGDILGWRSLPLFMMPSVSDESVAWCRMGMIDTTAQPRMRVLWSDQVSTSSHHTERLRYGYMLKLADSWWKCWWSLMYVLIDSVIHFLDLIHYSLSSTKYELTPSPLYSALRAPSLLKISLLTPCYTGTISVREFSTVSGGFALSPLVHPETVSTPCPFSTSWYRVIMLSCNDWCLILIVEFPNIFLHTQTQSSILESGSLRWGLYYGAHPSTCQWDFSYSTTWSIA